MFIQIFRKKNYYLIMLILIIFTIFFMIGCTDRKDKVSKTGFYFNTAITITLYNSSEKDLDACFDICKEYENKFSSTIETSEISQINNNSKNGQYTEVSNDTIDIINKGIYFGELSNGKFDITIGYLSNLWNFSSNNPCVPEISKINDSIKHINYKKINIDGNSVLIEDSDSKIDLGGIAKGYIADKIKEYLLSNGIKKGIINLGGNVLLIGSKEDNTNYNIGIQKPFGGDNDIIAIVNANDKSIVTSGVYERYFYEKDILYHHILDIKTGFPVENNLLSVTIISKDSVTGDGLSTSVFLLGLEDGKKLIEELDDTEAIFVDSNYDIYLSSGLSMNDNIISCK